MSKVNEPQLSALAFEQRCKALAVGFGAALALDVGDVAFAPELSENEAAMILVGRASEKISRNRGNAHRVVPLCRVTDDVFAWTGYRELWQKKNSEHNFRFVEGGFTLHIGRQGDLLKPQVLRSEWGGRRSTGFSNQAGHPHWQLDVLESARAHFPEAPATFGDLVAPAIEFSANTGLIESHDLLLRLTVERIHLASAALWWRQPAVSVAHQPETVPDLNRWLLGCVAYLRQEFKRCAILGLPA